MFIAKHISFSNIVEVTIKNEILQSNKDDERKK